MVRFLLVCVVVLCYGMFITCQAVEIRVPGDYDTIQAAVDASENGDEVIVANGTYRGEGNRDLNFQGKAITVRSAQGAEKCILDCGGTEADPHRAFLFTAGEDDNLIVDGFTITQGYQTSGGAVYLSGSSPVIQNCYFLTNHAAQYGGAIECYNYCNPMISYCAFQDNSGGIGAGIFCANSNPVIQHCTFTNNIATSGGGGGIGCYTASPEIRYCTFIGNSASEGGGILCEQDSDPNILFCTFTGNTVTHFGGGISVRNDCDAFIHGCHIYNNVAGSYGGGIFFTQGVPTIQNSLIAGNTSEFEGGGISCYQGEVTIINCSIMKNRSLAAGGGISCRWLSDVLLANSIVWGNASSLQGDQIAVNDFANPSTLTVSYSDAQGGPAAAFVAGNCTLNWQDGNLDVDPDFVSPGYWDDNNTPADESDDTWIMGCWNFLPGSDCINVADNALVETGATDLAGQNRILNGTVDMGAYENDPVDLDVDKITVKAGKTRQAKGDSGSVSGSLNASESSFLAANTITLRTGEMAETLNRTAFTQSGKNPKYTYKGPSGGITSLILDFKKGVYSSSGKDLDLTGMSAPAPVALLFGDYYGYADAEDQGANDVINGKKSLPVQLLVGHEDYLHATKIKCKQGKSGNVGNLTCQGGIAVETFVDLATSGLTIHWGMEQYVLQGGNFTAKGTNKYVGKVKPSGGDSSSATVTIDYNKCTFKVVLKNTNMAWQASPVDFGLEFDSFNEQEVVNF
jgi:predicted outer membrane repeat protein